MNSALMLNARSSPAVAGSYLAGAIVGASITVTVLAVLAGLVSPIPQNVRAIALLVGVAALALRTAGALSFPVPQNSRQIPQDAFRSKPTRAAFRFALELGTSARTYVTTDAPYGAALLIILLLPSRPLDALFHAALLAIGFGIGRAWIVASQQFRDAMIVEHPPWALRVANLLSLTSVAWLAIRVL